MHIRLDPHGQTVTQFDLGDMLTLLVHQVVGDWHRSAHENFTGTTAHALFLDLAQNAERHVIIRADQARAMARWAWRSRGFDHARTQTLT